MENRKPTTPIIGPGSKQQADRLPHRAWHMKPKSVSSLSVAKINGWIDLWVRHNDGHLPGREDGMVPGSDGETWKSIDIALKRGDRGLDRDAAYAHALIEKSIQRPHMKITPARKYSLAELIADSHGIAHDAAPVLAVAPRARKKRASSGR